VKYVFAAIFAAILVFSQWRPATVLSAVLVVLFFGLIGLRSETLFRDRSFFGTHQVRDRAEDAMRVYSNGTTVHGAQRLSELEAERPSPLYYYISGGPLGQIMQSDFGSRAKRVGVVGLGVGALACYARPGQDWHFYEIDKTVDDVARNPALFTFMSRCTPDAPTHMGDARMVLERQKDMRFDVLVIDAYSSDAVPVHLTTTEAMQLYLDRLTPGGILMYHISNRYYEIHRPLTASADALGVEIRLQNYLGTIDQDQADVPSKVALITANPELLTQLDADPRWQNLEPDGLRLWTDDYANALSILKARGKH
jgi:SAM-dependent methyltransferase